LQAKNKNTVARSVLEFIRQLPVAARYVMAFLRAEDGVIEKEFAKHAICIKK
jgi:hypothetical protein